MSYGSETDALGLFTALTADDTIVVPAADLSGFELPGTDWLQPITKLANADVTTESLAGTGTFDVMMASLAVQLKSEYAANRITGAEYTKAYIAMVQTAMQSAIQFLLGKDQAFWQAVQAQTAAVTAQVELETAKLRYAGLELEVLTNKANYAAAKIRLATEDANYGAAKYNIDNLLPMQLATGEYNLNSILPQQVAAGQQQVLQSQAQTLQIEQQTILVQKQQLSTAEQTEATRAQTQDVRSDGVTPVAGVLGMQKSLYSQQIASYKRDAENKAVKIFSDAWITMLTINESTPVPQGFSNANLDTLLGAMVLNNDLGPLVNGIGVDPLA